MPCCHRITSASSRQLTAVASPRRYRITSASSRQLVDVVLLHRRRITSSPVSPSDRALLHLVAHASPCR
ncbi:unnamed protein product [Arabis nemorensis]|uniref:Uncharacterized protein n=1 Tax=Arabis nemorensis TaxID=586526 RepID=A0A565CPG5_9BRAS|nr:unnamed protein product [Arabis nemorensis]